MERSVVSDLPRKLLGRVRDGRSGRSLGGARVELVTGEKSRARVLSTTRTDARGEFLLPISVVQVGDAERDSFRLRVEVSVGGTVDVVVTWSDLVRGHIDVVLDSPTQGPWISGVSPRLVLPGSFVEIDGGGFGEIYGDVAVWVGGREALVLAVSPTQLLVRIPPTPGELDPLFIVVAGTEAGFTGLFEAAFLPRPDSVGSLGRPATFSGAREGSQ